MNKSCYKIKISCNKYDIENDIFNILNKMEERIFNTKYGLIFEGDILIKFISDEDIIFYVKTRDVMKRSKYFEKIFFKEDGNEFECDFSTKVIRMMCDHLSAGDVTKEMFECDDFLRFADKLLLRYNFVKEKERFLKEEKFNEYKLIHAEIVSFVIGEVEWRSIDSGEIEDKIWIKFNTLMNSSIEQIRTIKVGLNEEEKEIYDQIIDKMLKFAHEYING